MEPHFTSIIRRTGKRILASSSIGRSIVSKFRGQILDWKIYREDKRYWEFSNRINVEYNPLQIQQDICKRIEIKREGKKRKGNLRIFSAYHHSGWEDHSFGPAIEKFGEHIRYDWADSVGLENGSLGPQWRQKMNSELLGLIKKEHIKKPIDLFFGYLSGVNATPELIDQINSLGIITVSFSLNDREFFEGKSKGQYLGLKELAKNFDLCWTSTKDACVKYLCEGGRPFYLPEGGDNFIYHDLGLDRDIDVSFLGACYGVRPSVLGRLRKKGFNVAVYGKGWPEGEIETKQIVELYNRSKIVLGFGLVGDSSKLMCLKGRDFEVPMSGSFYLTQYNPELEDFFEIGKEIICYKSFDELERLVRYYLQKSNLRETIRMSGYQRVIKDHTWERRFESLFKYIGLI